MDELKNRRCLALIVRERWLFGECRGEAASLYLQLDENYWAEIAPSKVQGCWVLSRSDSAPTEHVDGDGDSHYRLRNVGEEYALTGQHIENIYQKKLGERIEICIEFSNSTDITMHYKLHTHESSFYFIRS